MQKHTHTQQLHACVYKNICVQLLQWIPFKSTLPSNMILFLECIKLHQCTWINVCRFPLHLHLFIQISIFGVPKSVCLQLHSVIRRNQPTNKCISHCSIVSTRYALRCWVVWVMLAIHFYSNTLLKTEICASIWDNSLPHLRVITMIIWSKSTIFNEQTDHRKWLWCIWNAGLLLMVSVFIGAAAFVNQLMAEFNGCCDVASDTTFWLSFENMFRCKLYGSMMHFRP